MFLVYLIILINLPFYFLRLIETIKEYKRMYKKLKIYFKDKFENYRSEL